jgi:hypothetical protein
VPVQDTFWIQCGFADIAKMSNSCHPSPRSRFRYSKAKRGEGYDDILDLDDYPEIETNLVTEMSTVRHAA